MESMLSAAASGLLHPPLRLGCFTGQCVRPGHTTGAEALTPVSAFAAGEASLLAARPPRRTQPGTSSPTAQRRGPPVASGTLLLTCPAWAQQGASCSLKERYSSDNHCSSRERAGLKAEELRGLNEADVHRGRPHHDVVGLVSRTFHSWLLFFSRH